MGVGKWNSRATGGDEQLAVEPVGFHVDVQRSGRGYLVTLTAQQIYGSSRAALALNPESQEWREFRERISAQQTSDSFFRTVGSRLFEGLLPEQHQFTYEINYQSAKKDVENRLLRLQLRLLDDEIIDLPWECLYNSAAKLWLGANPLTPLSRYVDATAPPPLQLQPPLKLLIVTAEPKDRPPVQAEREVEALRRALSPLLRDGLLTAVRLARATPRSLSRAVQEFHPHLFHFVGHGRRVVNAYSLLLETDQRASEELPVDTLYELFQQSGQVRAAVLNACETSGAALALARLGIAAVGMRDKIRSEAAIPFCRSFYEAVASSLPLDVAVNKARFSIRLECGGNRRDWCLPAVFLPAGRAELFQIDRSARLVRVTSDPPGAAIFLDGAATDKTTPETLVISDDHEHEIHAERSGHGRSPAQRVRAGGREPAQVHFSLKAAPGFLVVTADRPGARIAAQRYGDSEVNPLGTMDATARLGPSPLPPGQYRVTASWPEEAGEGALTAEDEITIRQGEVTTAQLRFPAWVPLLEPARRIRLGSRRVLIGVSAGLCVLAAVVAAVVHFGFTGRSTEPPLDPVERPRPAPTPPLEMEMVALPGGEAHLGYWDSTLTMRLIQKHWRESKEAASQLLSIRPRTVTVGSFFIDQFEVTNAEYRKFMEAVKENGDAAWRHRAQPAKKKDHTPATWADERSKHLIGDRQPVVGVDFYDAYAYAKWRGKRLPTADEWELAARGTDGRPYPWGEKFQTSRSNQNESDTTSTAPVGQFIGDRSPHGVYDMGGNVSEWTTTPAGQGDSLVIRGGMWNLGPGEILALTFMRRYGSRGAQSGRVGFRCVMDAPPGGAVPPGMALVPGGRVSLGGQTSAFLEYLRGLPLQYPPIQKVFLDGVARKVRMEALLVARHEVTNAQYRRFLKEVGASDDTPWRHPDQPSGKDHTPMFWADPDFNKDDQPVVGVDWFDAYAFAKWAGMRLPTADEWEYAARGSTTNIYPWGDEFSPDRCNGGEGPRDAPAPVGSFPGDRSPVGLMDLGGNVMEWTATEEKSGKEPTMLLKGGSWKTQSRMYGAVYLRTLSAARDHRDNKVVGIRCVRDVRRK